jgi:integrase
MNYDPQEYDLVKRIRHTIAGVSEGIAASTAADYDRVYGHMMRTHSTPDDATSRSAYYRRRAALLFVCSQQAREALRARDRAAFGSPERLDALSELKRLASIFSRYPPDPEKTHSTEVTNHRTWSDIRSQLEAVGHHPTSHSKRRGLGALVRRKGWQTELFAQVTDKYRAAVAVLLLTGVRPAELAQGVVVRVVADDLEISVPGAKLSTMRGQPLRTLLVKCDSPYAKHLALLAGNSEITISADAKRLCDTVRKAGRCAFPRMHGTVSPYSLRHAVASALKAAGIDPDGIAQVLGHQATRSQQSYGMSCHGRQETAILGVRASVPVRDTGRNPVGVGHRTSAPKLG